MGYIKDPPGLVFNVRHRPLSKADLKAYKASFENEVRKMREKEAKEKKYHASENSIAMVSEPESEFKVKKAKIKKKRSR